MRRTIAASLPIDERAAAPFEAKDSCHLRYRAMEVIDFAAVARYFCVKHPLGQRLDSGGLSPPYEGRQGIQI
jgi:hypothetical protein